MENQFLQTTRGPISRAETKAFLPAVFTWMLIGLGISALLAYYFGTPERIAFMYSEGIDGASLNMMGYIVMFSPLAFVLLMSFGMQKLSLPVLSILFLVYSAVMGISLSSIFMVYSGAVLAKTFAITSLTFGAMAIAGYTTKVDLSKMGSILMMALVGLIIASIINWIWPSGMLDLVISIIGVIIFTGLTAYDVQRLKRIGQGIEYGNEGSKKLALMGGLSLYLNFVNLFLFLLRLFGGSRD